MSLERVTSNPRHWLRSIVCLLGLLLVSQLALAAQPCMDHATGKAVASPAGWTAGCPDMTGAADLCVAKSRRNDVAATYYASGDLPSFAMPPVPAAGAHFAPLDAGAISAAGPGPGHSPPVHIRFRRFLS